MLDHDAFTPPEQFEMKLGERPNAGPTENAPVMQGQAESSASKRPKSGLVTLPSKSAKPADSAAPSDK